MGDNDGFLQEYIAESAGGVVLVAQVFQTRDQLWVDVVFAVGHGASLDASDDTAQLADGSEQGIEPSGCFLW